MYTALHREPGPNGSITWRCENQHVLACYNGGVTGPCDKKDVSRSPTAATRDFCRDNPGAEMVPAFATSHYTIFDWMCSGRTPRIRRAFMHPDRRGFMPEEWTEVNY